MYPIITDYSLYRQEMSKGIEEKLFFLNHIPDIDVLFDYGCADGALIETLNTDAQFVCLGYDINPKMIDFANQKKLSNTYFSVDLNFLTQWITSFPKQNSVLLCSSLIHEVYSYGTSSSIAQFWKYLFSGHFKYIVIRDMALCHHDETQISHIHDIQKIMNYGNPSQIQSFTQKWGDFSSFKNLVHFLLKYRYTTNWNREVCENYLPLTFEDYQKIIPSSYHLIFQKHAPMSYLQKQIQYDFDIDLQIPTHLRLILKKHDA